MMYQETAITNDTEKFHELLDQYKDSALRIIYEYYRDDLIYIVESLNTRSFLSELKIWTKLQLKRYLLMREDLGDSIFAETLVKDILEAGREAVIGDTLVKKILLDEHGHNLSPELKGIQEKHKQHLLEKTQVLVEHRPPGSTQEQQSFSITERYVNMIVVSINHFRQRSQHELIETGRRNEDIMSKEWFMMEHIALNKLFHWSCQKQCEPSVVMVSGVPGIGKTTLMQKFVHDWVNGKLYQRFAFVFFFKFRELNRLDKVSLETMILQQYPYLQRQLGNILQDPEKLLFIFDGLDESNHQIDFTSGQLCGNIKQIETLGVIVVSLLRKSLLNGCSVLMTSRPTKLASVEMTIFQRTSEIMGFLPKERQIYFEYFFPNKELSDKALDYVRKNDTLFTFCYIPSYCWIVCTVLSICFKAQPENTDQLMSSLPKTMTQLFVTFVANILSNHNQDKRGARELMTSIGWMAEHGVMNHLIVFDERDLRTFNVDTSSHLLSSFMIESDQSTNVTFSFLHLTVQEFVAALVHFLDYSPEKLQSSLDKTKLYTDGRAEIYLQFLCGFLDSWTRSVLKSLGEFSIKALKAATSWLKKSLTDARKDIYRDTGKFLNILGYLFESQNRALVEECLGSNSYFTFHSLSHLTPVDCTILAFVLKSCKQTEYLNVGPCNIQKEGWEKLAPALHTIKRIDLCSTGLKDSYIHCIASALKLHECRIQELILSCSGLTDSSCSQLASAIKDNQSLRILDLSSNHLGGPHFCELATALSSPTCRIEELLLREIGLTETSCYNLASVVRNNQSLRKLDLSYNCMAGPHFNNLMTAVSNPTCRIEELLLSHTQLPESSCSTLASAIHKNQFLRNLDLSGNNLAGPRINDSMTAESSPTCQLEELLSHTRLTESSWSILTSAIRTNQSLRRLNLSSNNLDGPHFSDLMTAVFSPTCRIEELILRDTGLTDNSSSQLFSAVNKNQSLRKLDLSNNNLDGPHFSDLMTALSSPSCWIEKLDFENTKLTDQHAPILVSLINKTNLIYLNLSCNKFQDRGYNVIKELIQRSTSLKEIGLLNIQWTEKQKEDLLEMQRPGLKIHCTRIIFQDLTLTQRGGQ